MSRAARTASHTQIAYNSCRNRHCPKCQGAAAKEWLAEREAELLPVPYYHVVFTLPAPIGDIAYQNKAVIYDILFKASAETLITIAADPKHLGARIGITSVLHTWGSAMTHHPHVHMIVPGGGISLDGERWCRAGRASSCPCACSRACSAGCSWRSSSRRTTPAACSFFGDHAPLAECASLRGLSGAAAQNRMGRLRKAPVRRARGGARLSRRATPTASPSPTAG